MTARPPSFVRRHAAGATDDPNTLVLLACDDNVWVRRDAARNPATPRWILDLLVRAGADPHLRGRRSEPDPTLTPADLHRLVEGGPWARRLVAEHPAADATVLDVLAGVDSIALRLLVAAHVNTASTSLDRLCADIDADVRALAAEHPATPPGTVRLLVDGGATPDLRTVAARGHPDGTWIEPVAELGAFGRFLAARHASCPADLTTAVAGDEDWRVRSAVLDNTLVSEIPAIAATDTDPVVLERLADDDLPEVRLAVARHPATDPATLGRLAADELPDIRRTAARDPRTDPEAVDALVRAGSTPDLTGLAEPDPNLDPALLTELAAGGHWARLLAVRHPATPPITLARLLCDAEPKLREWAAAHPSAPAEVIALLRRAGAADDWQGVAEGDPTMTPEELDDVSALGPWGEWVVSWHPNAPRPG